MTSSTDIVLTTLNAKYIHTAFGLRYLLANMGELASQTALREFNINQDILDIAEELCALHPRIIGLGVYIWNVAQTEKLVAILRGLLPNTTIVLGGPEVSFEVESQSITALADYVVTGEADITFPQLCRELLTGQAPAERVIRSAVPKLEEIELPYHLYTEEDLTQRVVYVEASRGCPFTCEFCLSSLDVPVRAFELEPFLNSMKQLFDRGARSFKFVDRTFNLNLKTARTILDFFWERYVPELFVHFEMVPDRLPTALRESIQRFPPAALQFEVGIQTFHPEVSALISRRQDYQKIEENLRFLREETGVHIHADLIVGLPGETMASFSAGFDRLVALRPHEIQVGILKRLRGTPIIRHDAEWEMLYRSDPPYEVLSTKTLPFDELQRLRRFAKYWDMVANSGRFAETLPLLWEGGCSPFESFMQLSDALYQRLGRRHSIALQTLVSEFARFLIEERAINSEQVARSLFSDFSRIGQSDYLPGDIRKLLPAGYRLLDMPRAARGQTRQERHL